MRRGHGTYRDINTTSNRIEGQDILYNITKSLNISSNYATTEKFQTIYYEIEE